MSEKRTVYLIGTSHRYQVRTSAIERGESLDVSLQAVEDFENLLNEVTETNRVRAIGEEFCENHPILRCEGARSIAARVAVAHRILHIFCDPDETQRAQIGLMSHADCGLDEENGFPKREKFWLDCVSKIPASSILIICGANHIKTFPSKLTEQGYNVVVKYADWSPETREG